MVIYVSLLSGALGTVWDSSTAVWDAADTTWDAAGGGEGFSDWWEARLKKSVGDNNSTSRLEITFPNMNGLHVEDFNEADEIVLYADQDVNPPTTKIFAGVLVEKSYEGERHGNYERIKLIARDYTALLQKNTVEPEVYTNQEVSVIVEDLMLKYAPTNFTTTNVQTTTLTLPRISFKQLSVFDAIKQLADQVGYVFYVDNNKDLHFKPRSTVSSGVTLDNTNVIKSEFVRDIDSVKNRIYVYGNKHLVKRPQETFTADGTGSVFTLANNPYNTQIRVSGAEKKGDVYKSAETVTSGPEYLVNFHDKQIIFLSGTDLGYTSIPGSLVQVTADYWVSKPIIKLAEDQTSMILYGKRTEVITDENIFDPVLATRLAKNTLANKKEPPVMGTLSVYGVFPLTPGETVIVNLPYEDQDTQTHDILEANYVFNKDTCFKEKVLTVKVSSRINDINDVIKDIILALRKVQAGQVDDAGILTRLMQATGSFGFRVPEWQISTRSINDTFIPGHPDNGIAGIVAGNDLVGSIIGSIFWESGLTNTGYNKALHFVGSDALRPRVESLNYSGLINGSGDFSVACWFKPDTIGMRNVLFFRLVGGANLYPRASVETTGSVSFQFRVNNVTKSLQAGNFVAGQTSHVVMQYDPNAGSASIWQNGSLMRSVSVGLGSLTYGPPGSLFTIGYDSNLNAYCSGTIDDLRIYNKVLSSSEIGSLYIGQNITGSLVGYYKFDEGVGSVVYSSTSGTDYKLQPIIGDRRTSLAIQASGGE